MSEVQEFRHILVIEDRKGRRIVSLEEKNYTIGRDSNNPIVLYDYQVSRTHATLIRKGEEHNGNSNTNGNGNGNNDCCYRIIDGDLQGKKSTNGISINGKATISHELKHGDNIHFASEAKANYYIINKDSGIDLFNPEGLERVSASRITLNSQSSDTMIKQEIEKEQQQQDSEEQQELIRLASFPELSPNPIIELDWTGNLTYVNPAASFKFENIREEGLNHPILMGLISEDSNRQGNLFLREVKIGSEVFEQYVHYLSEKKVIRSYIFDFTKRKIAEAQLKDSQARYQTIIRQSSEGVFLAYATNRRIIEANPALINLLGYSHDELTNLSIYSIIASDLTSINNDLTKVLESKGDLSGKYLFRRQDASLLNLEASISITNYQNKDIFCFVVRNQTSEQKPTSPSYSKYHDPITHLPNQKLFEEQLAIAVTKADTHQYLMGIIAIELENWEKLNEDENDPTENNQEQLANITQILQANLDENDLLARWSDNQFMILSPRVKGPKDPARISKKISQTLTAYLENEEKLSSNDIKAHVSLLIYPIDGDNSSLIIKNTLQSLEQSKAGNNSNLNYGTSDLNLTPKSASLLKLENLIGNAFKEQQFFLCYQPQIDSTNREITGLEALLRWDHPELGKVTPRHFLRLTEETDFMLPLGVWILQTATAQMQRWHKEQISAFPISVNISTRQFTQPNFVATIVKILEQTGLPPEYLELEFTETCFVKNPDLAYQTLEQLSALKVNLCFDNFGAGNCALIHLDKVPFNTVKISPQVISKIDNDRKTQALIQSMATLCQGYNARLIGVGIEKIEQMELLRQLGCTQIQGNLFSRPLPHKEIGIFLQKSENNTVS